MRRTSAYILAVVPKAHTNIVYRYGAVVRGTGAYVPPGARKTPLSPPPPTSTTKADIPKVAVNAPDGTSIPDKAPSPAPTATSANKVGMVDT